MSRDDRQLTITLSGGLRVATRSYPGSSEYCGLLIDAGSRDEAPQEQGVAHFVEHTVFKGTERRSARRINAVMEDVGGDLNAFTSREHTAITTAAPAGNARRAVELLADLVTRPTFPPEGIEIEKGVVTDEIALYLDEPSESVFDLFDEAVYPRSPLGRNILGTPESVRSFSSEDCQRWVRRRFTPGRMVLYYLGPEKEERIQRLAERYFTDLTRPEQPLERLTPAEPERFDRVIKKGLHQTHTVSGIRIPGLYSDERFTWTLLAHILGGPCMNSLLVSELRERHGWAYAVDCTTALLTDCGQLSIYFGGDERDRAKCQRAITRIVTRLADKPLSERALRTFRRQVEGQSLLRTANPESVAMQMGTAALRHQQLLSRQDLHDALEAVTPGALQDAAAKLLGRSTLTLA